MAATVPNPQGKLIPIDTIFNLRMIDGKGKLYRAAKQDLASQTDIERCLQELSIRTFLDCRNKVEYRLKSQPKRIDSNVTVLVPAIPNPKTVPYPSPGEIQLKNLEGKPVKLPETEPRRYLINFFTFSFFMHVFNMAPFYLKLYGLLCLLVDLILRNNFKYIVRSFSKLVAKIHLKDHYFNMLVFGGQPLCFVLKTLSNPDNLPAIVSCAHGKDRTGVITALILSILGKSDEYIAQDYALSEEGLKSVQSQVYADTVLKYNVDPSYALAKKETIVEVLKDVRSRYGSVENFLESIGFGSEDQDKLRRVLG